MIETMQSVAEAIKDIAQKAINGGAEITDCPLHIQVSSDHTEIHMLKGDLHLMVAVTGDDCGIYNCTTTDDALQNPYWVNEVKVSNVIADMWAVAYDIDRVMVAS